MAGPAQTAPNLVISFTQPSVRDSGRRRMHDRHVTPVTEVMCVTYRIWVVLRAFGSLQRPEDTLMWIALVVPPLLLIGTLAMEMLERAISTSKSP
jgi:hypothetical protein